MKMKLANSSSLPDEIIEEILARVSSVKSLLRFKCLSKLWNSFMSTEKFIKNKLPIRNYGIFISKFHDHFGSLNHFVVDHYPMDVLFSETSIRKNDHGRFELPYSYTYSYTDDSTCVVGCSNGLCCILVCEEDLVLLNPFTRKSFKLPPPFDESCRNDIRGFGYDESNDDYKVLIKSLRRSSFRLYSLKTNSWKTVDNFIGSAATLGDFLAYCLFKSTGVLVNGKLHWVVKSDNSLKIVSFDLGNETVGMVEPPSSIDVSMLYWAMLGVIGGYLCVFHGSRNEYGSRNEGTTHVWRMMEYGTKESWYRVVTVPNLYTTHYDVGYEPPYPLDITDEGNVLVVHGGEFIYNPKTKSKRRLNVTNPSKQSEFSLTFSSS